MRLEPHIQTARINGYLFFFANGFLFGNWATRIPIFKAELDLSDAMMGTLFLAMGIGALTASFFSFAILRSFTALTLARFFSIMMAVWFLCLPMAQSYGMLALFLCLMGMSAALMDVTMNAYAAQIERIASRAFMSSFHGAWSIGTSLASGFGYLTLKMDITTYHHFLSAIVFLLILTLFFNRAHPLLIEDSNEVKHRTAFNNPDNAAFYLLNRVFRVCC